MEHKLRSIKLWLFIGMIVLTTFMRLKGAIEPQHWASICEGLFYAFVIGNVGTKFAGKGDKDANA